MALNAYERRIIELIRKSKNVTITFGDGIGNEFSIKVGGRCPREIALSIQSMYNENHNDNVRNISGVR